MTGAGIANNSVTGEGIDESKLGVQTGGLQFLNASSANDSASPKFVNIECPVGTRVVFGGYDLQGGKTGAPPNEYSDVVMDEFVPNADGRRILTTAHEENPHAGNWQLHVTAYCVSAG